MNWLLGHGSLQQNYRFFTVFIFSGGKGNQVGSRQWAVGSLLISIRLKAKMQTC